MTEYRNIVEFENVDQYFTAMGILPGVAKPHKDWLRGPFYLEVTMPTDGSEVNLNTATVINSDPQISEAFGGTGVPDMFLFITGMRLLSFDPAFATASGANKLAVSGLSVRWKRRNDTGQMRVGQTMSERYKGRTSIDTNTAVDAESYLLDGVGPIRNGGRLKLDLEKDEFAIQAHTSLSAGYKFVIEIEGGACPNDVTRDRVLTGKGKACGNDEGLQGTLLAEALNAREALGPSINQIHVIG